MMCEAERETVPEEAQRQLADAGAALSRALEECRAVLRQNRQVRGLMPTAQLCAQMWMLQLGISGMGCPCSL